MPWQVVQRIHTSISRPEEIRRSIDFSYTSQHIEPDEIHEDS